jgi:hypothetical protein
MFCSFCGGGTYQTGQRMISLRNRSLCVSGKYQSGLGMADPLNCSLCTDGTFRQVWGWFQLTTVQNVELESLILEQEVPALPIVTCVFLESIRLDWVK